jgi:hypothetical protein
MKWKKISSGLIPAHIQDTGRRYRVDDFIIGEYLLYRKFDADWLDVERCLKVLKRLAVDLVVKGSIRVHPYEWRSDKVLGHMAKLKWFVSAPRRFHEYLMKHEGVMTDFLTEMREGSTERGSNINESKTNILTVKCMVGVLY